VSAEALDPVRTRPRGSVADAADPRAPSSVAVPGFLTAASGGAGYVSAAPVAVAAERLAARRLQRRNDALLAALGAERKSLPLGLGWDGSGAALHARLTQQPEYYFARAEAALWQDASEDLREWIGPRAGLIEFGFGRGSQARPLLDRLEEPRAIELIDLAGDGMRRDAPRLGAERRGLRVRAQSLDPQTALATPPAQLRRSGLMLGGAIGDQPPELARASLRGIARLVGPGGLVLVTVDLKKDPALIEAAHNDGAGLAAAFGLNRLRQINREFGGGFPVDRFRHLAFYEPVEGRIESHLVATAALRAGVADRTIDFAAGETIHAASTYLYLPAEFRRLADQAGFEALDARLDPEGKVALFALRAR